MDVLIWSGAAVSLFGVGVLLWCIREAHRARKTGTDDQEIRTRLQKVVTVNLIALMISAIGLMMVVVGIILS